MADTEKNNTVLISNARSDDQGIGARGVILCVERLKQLIRDETSLLKSGAQIDLDSFNLRKTHALLELNSVTRNFHGRHDHEITAHLRELADELALNKMALELHLQALQEVMRIVVDKIRKDDSYGTYSRKSALRR